MTALGTVDEVTRRLRTAPRARRQQHLGGELELEPDYPGRHNRRTGTRNPGVASHRETHGSPDHGHTRSCQGRAGFVVPERLQRDEIGEIGDTLAVFKANMIEADRLRGEQETQKQRSAQEGRRAISIWRRSSRPASAASSRALSPRQPNCRARPGHGGDRGERRGSQLRSRRHPCKRRKVCKSWRRRPMSFPRPERNRRTGDAIGRLDRRSGSAGQCFERAGEGPDGSAESAMS